MRADDHASPGCAAASAQPYPFVDTARPFGRFPVGVWGLPQDPNNRKVPKAEMIEALNELDLVCGATPSGGGPEIPYYQVEIGKRRPLPFTRRAPRREPSCARLASAVTELLARAGRRGRGLRQPRATFLGSTRLAHRAGRAARRAAGAAARWAR